MSVTRRNWIQAHALKALKDCLDVGFEGYMDVHKRLEPASDLIHDEAVAILRRLSLDLIHDSSMSLEVLEGNFDEYSDLRQCSGAQTKERDTAL